MGSVNTDNYKLNAEEQKTLDDLIDSSPEVRKNCQKYENALDGWINTTKKMKKKVFDNFKKYTDANLCNHLEFKLKLIEARGFTGGRRRRRRTRRRTKRRRKSKRRRKTKHKRKSRKRRRTKRRRR